MLKSKVISMTKIYDLINRIEKLDRTKENVDKATCNEYQSININLNDIIETIVYTGITSPTKKCLMLFFNRRDFYG